MSQVRIVSYSEIDCSRQCQHKHELAYKQRWQSPTTSPALSRGTLVHAVLERHYRALWAYQKGEIDKDQLRAEVALLRRELLQPEVGQQTEEQALVEWIYEGYLKHYGLDEGWLVLAVEHHAEAWLPTDTGARSRFKLKVKIDLIVRDRYTNQLIVIDHKSGKDLPKDKELDIDDQFGLYPWCMRQLGHDVFGLVHNALRTQRNKDQVKNPQPLEERFKRTRLHRTEVEMDNLAVDAYREIRAAYQWKPGQAPRSPNPDTCRWKCDYTEACLLGRKGVDERQALEDLGYVQNFERH